MKSKSAVQRLQALDADLAEVKAARTVRNRKISLKTIGLLPHAVVVRMQEWRRFWLEAPEEIERQLAEVAVLGSDPFSTARYPALSRWVVAIADTPDDGLPPTPPAEAQAQLERMAEEWECAAVEKCAGQLQQRRAALWFGGFCRYFACLAEVLNNTTS